jgi:hypothetical protein
MDLLAEILKHTHGVYWRHANIHLAKFAIEGWCMEVSTKEYSRRKQLRDFANLLSVFPTNYLMWDNKGERVDARRTMSVTADVYESWNSVAYKVNAVLKEFNRTRAFAPSKPKKPVAKVVDVEPKDNIAEDWPLEVDTVLEDIPIARHETCGPSKQATTCKTCYSPYGWISHKCGHFNGEMGRVIKGVPTQDF